MHDPSTMAFSIKWPFKTKGDFKHYPSLLSIWHNDPMDFTNKCNCRGDDSCGWFTPPYSSAVREEYAKLAKQQYGEIFNKQRATKENKSYAYICYDQDCYGAIYWSWRAIASKQKKYVWQYGKPLSAGELNYIYSLATCPVDNLQTSYSLIEDEGTFENFFMCVFNAYLRHHRPWYKHPRWHFWHWSFQFHPWQNLKRRFWDKCSKCGKHGFPKGVSAIGNWSGNTIWHSTCDENHAKMNQQS